MFFNNQTTAPIAAEILVFWCSENKIAAHSGKKLHIKRLKQQ